MENPFWWFKMQYLDWTQSTIAGQSSQRKSDKKYRYSIISRFKTEHKSGLYKNVNYWYKSCWVHVEKLFTNIIYYTLHIQHNAHITHTYNNLHEEFRLIGQQWKSFPLNRCRKKRKTKGLLTVGIWLQQLNNEYCQGCLSQSKRLHFERQFTLLLLVKQAISRALRCQEAVLQQSEQNEQL